MVSMSNSTLSNSEAIDNARRAALPLSGDALLDAYNAMQRARNIAADAVRSATKALADATANLAHAGVACEQMAAIMRQRAEDEIAAKEAARRAQFQIATAHEDCEDCNFCIDSALTYAQATGSVSARFTNGKGGDHEAVATRIPQPLRQYS